MELMNPTEAAAASLPRSVPGNAQKWGNPRVDRRASEDDPNYRENSGLARNRDQSKTGCAGNEGCTGVPFTFSANVGRAPQTDGRDDCCGERQGDSRFA